MKTKVFLLSLLALLFTACKKDSGNEPDAPEFVEAVDLGLSVKWANVNVGATKPEEYGDYFAWGETSPKTDFFWNNYKHCKGTEYYMTKYCTSITEGDMDRKTVLSLADDAAHVNWGGNWRMPTKAEMEELINNCTWERAYAPDSYKKKTNFIGYTVIGKNGNSIFLPCAGCREHSEHFLSDEGGYWSSSLYEGGSHYAIMLWFRFDYDFPYGSSMHDRCKGYSIRAVCK